MKEGKARDQTSGKFCMVTLSAAALERKSLEEAESDAPRHDIWMYLIMPPCSFASCHTQLVSNPNRNQSRPSCSNISPSYDRASMCITDYVSQRKDTLSLNLLRSNKPEFDISMHSKCNFLYQRHYYFQHILFKLEHVPLRSVPSYGYLHPHNWNYGSHIPFLPKKAKVVANSLNQLTSLPRPHRLNKGCKLTKYSQGFDRDREKFYQCNLQ